MNTLLHQVPSESQNITVIDAFFDKATLLIYNDQMIGCTASIRQKLHTFKLQIISMVDHTKRGQAQLPIVPNYIYVYAYIHTHTQKCIYSRVCVCEHTHIYIYIYIYTHTPYM
uniref:Uncharacterized protein n=1 Tax=Opuntia streptacantha TaxID=393608 RepID=A0A7C9CFM4_OPUST